MNFFSCQKPMEISPSMSNGPVSVPGIELKSAVIICPKNDSTTLKSRLLDTLDHSKFSYFSEPFELPPLKEPENWKSESIMQWIKVVGIFLSCFCIFIFGYVLRGAVELMKKAKRDEPVWDLLNATQIMVTSLLIEKEIAMQKEASNKTESKKED